MTPFGLEAIASQFFASMAQQAMAEISANPQGFIEGLNDLFEHPHHTGYDACQDILDACEAGHISHEAATTAIRVLMADLQRRNERPATPPTAPAATTAPVDLAAFFRAIA